MGFPRREVLVLGDAGVRHLGVGVVHHSRALEVSLGTNFAKFERTIAKATEAITEVAVERSGIEDVIVGRTIDRFETCLQGEDDIRMLEDVLDDLRVAVFWQALETVVEVVVVVIEANRQSLQNRCWQLRGLHSPLLERVTAEKGLVEVITEECEGLLLKSLGIGDRFVAQIGNEFLGLRRRHAGAEELVDRVEVDWQRIDLALVGGLDSVHIGHHLAEAVDVVPDLLIVSMEDVRAVFVDLDASLRIALGMAVAGDVWALIDDMHRMPLLRQFAGNYRAAESGTDAEIV